VVAECKGHTRFPTSYGDMRDALFLASRLAGDSDKEATAHAAWLWAHTENLLNMEHVWHQVKALAALLLQEQTLTGKQVRDCGERAAARFREECAQKELGVGKTPGIAPEAPSGGKATSAPSGQAKPAVGQGRKRKGKPDS